MKPSDLPNSNNQYLFNIKVVKPKGCNTDCMIDILVDNVVLTMELDTGASVSIISGERCSGTTFEQFPCEIKDVYREAHGHFGAEDVVCQI